MKTQRMNARTNGKKIFLGFLALMIIIPFALEAKKIPFEQSATVPAAEGYVRINSDRNNNHTIKIHIKNLAEIERLDPSMKTYVVWMLTANETTQNIGQINSTKSLNVYFETVSSFQPIKIFITAEVNEKTQEPGKTLVLTTDNFYK